MDSHSDLQTGSGPHPCPWYALGRSTSARIIRFGLELGLLLLLSPLQPAAAATTETYSFLSLNRLIPDGNPSGISDVRSVSSALARISSLRVRLSVAGEFNGDLFAYVRHASPSGTNYCVLLNRPGRCATTPVGYGDPGLTVVLDDYAGAGDIHVYRTETNLPTGCQLSGNWQPDGRVNDPDETSGAQTRATSLSSFLGQVPGGDWTLFIADVDSGGTNVLLGWELQITGDTAFVGIPNQVARVSAPVVITNVLADASRWTGPLTFGLAPGAPAGAWLDPITGVFRWTPSRGQARSSNAISVWVADSGSPPAFATNTFNVTVDDYAELLVGQAVTLAGQTNGVMLTLVTSTGLTNVQTQLQVPQERLTNLTLVGWAPVLGGATLRQAMPNVWQMEFSAGESQVLQATQQLAWLQFQAVSNRSAFVPVEAPTLTVLQTNGTSVSTTFTSPGRVTVIAREPLIEVLPSTLQRPRLVLYGLPGYTYRLQSSPDVSAPDGWAPVWEGIIPAELWTTVDLTNSSPSPSIFFRAEERSSP
jgi:subtilisin-like proprotein convertase family protein